MVSAVTSAARGRTGIPDRRPTVLRALGSWPDAARPVQDVDGRTAEIRSNLGDREPDPDAHRSASPDEHHRLLWRFNEVVMTDGIPVVTTSCSSTAYKPRLRSAWTVCGLAMPSR
jgi:hypothetical protein